MVRVGIIGASGYAGGELIRLLLRHPEVQVAHLVSDTYAGQPLSKAFPGTAGTAIGNMICENRDVVRAAQTSDVLFLAGESGAAMAIAGELLELGKRVIDLSADFRLRDVNVYEKTYKIEHVGARLLDEGIATYGLPELNRDNVKSAWLVANPGCYPTATILGLAPLLQKRLVETRGIVVDAKSGVSGAGRSKSDSAYRYAEANEALKPYGVGGVHRHVPEIEQELSVQAAPSNIHITFTPHLVPMTRGLLATCYAPLADSRTTVAQVLSAFKEVYAETPFVVVRDVNDFPSTKDVYGSNFCHIAVTIDSRTKTVIVTSVIDNLVKGAAGQAIQNMNLMLGLPETLGLEGAGLWP
jgi:N-acetyl-gamma-glutamyl-phosphate reductase